MTNNKIRYFLGILFAISATMGYLSFSSKLDTTNILIGLAGVFAIFAIILLLHFIIVKFNKPPYFSYNEDIFYDIKWNWHWNLKKEILGLNPSCLTCGENVFYNFDTLHNKTEFICKKCDKQIIAVDSSHRNFAIESVKKSIIRKLKKEDPTF